WEENINPRPEFNKAKFLSLRYLFSFFNIPDNPACKSSCYLAEKDFDTTSFNNDGCSLVQCRRFRIPGHQIFAWMILKVLNNSRNGAPVTMHVNRRHEY